MAAESFYASIPESPRDAELGAYLRFLERRNGTTDADASFHHRDAWLRDSENWSAQHRGQLDADEFARRFAGTERSPQQNAAMSALLAFVKMNAGEAYGVEVVTRLRHKQPATGELLDRVERVVGKEETYHTKILLGATRQFGIAAPTQAWRPPLATRLVVGAIAHAPRTLFHPILLGTEIGGVFVFNWMLDRVREIFRDQPELRETLEQRLLEVLTDEIGHIAFNRIAVGPVGMGAARWMAPYVAHQTTGRLPEFRALGWDRNTVRRMDRFDLDALPEQARRHAFFV